MSIIGWYYLHTNGDLIFKRDIGDQIADFRESDFCVMFWPIDPEDRETAWRCLVESSVCGANQKRIEELTKKWKCTDEDAEEYVKRIGAVLNKDGDQWCVTRKDFINLQESPAGFGNTVLEALVNLCKTLRFKPSKMWGTTFKDLLKVEDKTEV